MGEGGEGGEGEVKNSAMLCPDSVGDAVYEARSLLALADVFISEEPRCNDSIPGKMQISIKESDANLKPQKLFVYPVPASDVIFFELSDATENEFIIAVHNTLGEKISELVIPAGLKKVKLELSGMTAGVYFYCGNCEGLNMERGKFEVVR